MKQSNSNRRDTTRRDFLKHTALVAGMGVWVASEPRVWALQEQSPNERINLACIGIGGKGAGDCEQASKHANLIAICDIDDQRLRNKGNRHPKAQRFNDFRKMFDKLGKEIDAVTISTPDHTHAVATMMAIKMGKAVYTQKPLAHDVWEVRQLRLAAAEHNVASQMGNQGTATTGLREGVEAVQAGAIGHVREVHVWTNRPIWPQSPLIRQRPPEAPVPSYIHWEEWLGTAPARPYAKKYYHPFNWRGWWDFGTGALGDMGCHIANLPCMALKLGYPTSMVAESEELNPETYPAWARVVYKFPARGDLPPVTLTWYEGHKGGTVSEKDGRPVFEGAQAVLPPKELIDNVVAEYNKVLRARGDKQVADGKTAGLSEGGSILVGDKGILYVHGSGKDWELLPADKFHDYKAPSPTLPRNPLGDDDKTVDEGQKLEWLNAVRGGPKPLANFDYAGILAEFIILGNVAIRAQGKELVWDGPNMKFPNAPEAERFLRREYRQPWAL
jgi:predicted dehydrogenase